MRKKRDKLHHFKVLTYLLYGTYDCVKWETPDTAYIRTGPWSMVLGITSVRLRQALFRLAEMGYLAALTKDHGWARVTVAKLPARADPPEVFAPDPRSRLRIERPEPTPAELDAFLKDMVDKPGRLW